jgi:hypothetical protein
MQQARQFGPRPPFRAFVAHEHPCITYAPVFNAPFSNTRSVAELVIAEVIALTRRLADRSREMHEGRWRKSAPSCYEVRGKTLDIVGYGHIGTHVGVLAEALGMYVLFHDIAPKLPIANAALEVDTKSGTTNSTRRVSNLIARSFGSLSIGTGLSAINGPLAESALVTDSVLRPGVLGAATALPAGCARCREHRQHRQRSRHLAV